MERSTRDAWLTGPSDLKEAVVEDVPTPGQSVKVRGLSAKFSAEVQGQLQLVQEGPVQVARIDVAAMERLQFEHGVIDPQFSPEEVAAIQERMGASFKKVIAVIDELSGVDKEAIEATEKRFPVGGDEPQGDAADGVAAGGNGSDVHVRTGAGAGHAGG